MSDVKVDTKESALSNLIEEEHTHTDGESSKTGSHTPLSPSRAQLLHNHEHAPAPPPSTMAVYPHELSLTNSPYSHPHSLAHSPLTHTHTLSVGTHLPQIPAASQISPSSLGASATTSPKAYNSIQVPRRSSFTHSPIVTSMLTNSPIVASLPLASRSTSPYSVSRSRSPHTSPPRSPQLEHGSILALHNEHANSISHLPPLTPLPESYPLSHSLSNPQTCNSGDEREEGDAKPASTSLSQLKESNSLSSSGSGST